MENKKIKLLAYAGGAMIVPYMYLFWIRPYLLKLESNLDNKITDISDRDLENMKRKLGEMRNIKKDD